jgi:hypothetical protein
MMNIIGPFFFEEPIVTGENFLAVKEDTALCCILQEFSQLDGALSHFSCCAHAFLDMEFPDH